MRNVVTEEKTSILLQLTVEFKDALGQYAQEHNKPSAEIIRLAIAIYIGYDVEKASIPSGRPRIYASKEDRLEAQKKKTKKERDLVKQLMADYEHAQHMEGVKTLEEWLERRTKQK